MLIPVKMYRRRWIPSSSYLMLMLVILLDTLCLLLLPMTSEAALSRATVKKKLRKNSPIYYIQTPYNFVNSQPFLSGLSTYTSLSSSLLLNRNVVRPLLSSTLYHLPTKYISNAKPTDVVSKKSNKKKGKIFVLTFFTVLLTDSLSVSFSPWIFEEPTPCWFPLNISVIPPVSSARQINLHIWPHIKSCVAVFPSPVSLPSLFFP